MDDARSRVTAGVVRHHRSPLPCRFSLLLTLLIALFTTITHTQARSFSPTPVYLTALPTPEPFNFTVIAPPSGYEEWSSPVVLPSPPQAGRSDWTPYIDRAKAFVAQLTIEEKINLTTGAGTNGRCVGQTGTIPRLGFNQPICLHDGPVGVRQTDFNSVFPAAINVAATFDKTLFYERAKALGEEFMHKGINVGLAPMTNLMRCPLAGRNWEGFGADPFLSGVATALSIRGIQITRLSACVKHFIGNEQEHFRGGSGGTASSSNIDDRTLRELYEWPFAEAIRAGTDYIMCSYNRINQTYACENSKLLNGIVKGEQRFQGVVVTDWAAAASGVRTALAGTDMNMPGFVAYGDKSEPNPATSKNSYWGLKLIEAVKNGSVPIERLDDMATRIISTYYKQGQDKSDYPHTNMMAWGQGTSAEEEARLNEHVNVQAQHHRLIREIGAASMILLKNIKQTLPLKSPDRLRSIVVIGGDSGDNLKGANGCSDRGCDNGTLATGWGSGTADFPYLITPASAIENYVRTRNPRISFQTILDDHSYTEIQRASRRADLALVHVNADSGEGYITVEGNAGDRNDYHLWHQGDQLILKTAEVCSNVVVVIHTVGPVDMEAWINHPNVTAVVLAGLPGQESGNSEVDVLWGGVNPSGRLPYTIGRKLSDYPAQLLTVSNMVVPQITYSEKLEIDYRHFDAKEIQPRFEYGFGLSYTTFEYSKLNIDLKVRSVHQLNLIDLYENVVFVNFAIHNVGNVDGHEVPQLYVGFPEAAKEPPKILRGFERIFIKKAELGQVSIKLRRKDISIWDVIGQEWQVPNGHFNIMVGSSSRRIHLRHSFELNLS